MLEIREILPSDYAAAGEVAVEGYREFYRERLGSYGDHLRDVESRARDAVVLVAIDEGMVSGVVTYVADATSPFAQHQMESEASIRMLSVAPAHKRRGIGRALSVACIERARADGKRAVVLHADEIMIPARALYQSLGFARDPGRDFRPDDETVLLCYVLRFE